MIDLNDLKWAGRAIVARRRRGCLDNLRFAAPPPSRLQINVFDTGLYRAPVWRPKARFLAANLNLAAQSRKRRAGRLQIEARDGLSDDFFARRVEHAKAVRRPRVRSIKDVTVPAARNRRIIRYVVARLSPSSQANSETSLPFRPSGFLPIRSRMASSRRHASSQRFSAFSSPRRSPISSTLVRPTSWATILKLNAVTQDEISYSTTGSKLSTSTSY